MRGRESKFDHCLRGQIIGSTMPSRVQYFQTSSGKEPLRFESKEKLSLREKALNPFFRKWVKVTTEAGDRYLNFKQLSAKVLTLVPHGAGLVMKVLKPSGVSPQDRATFLNSILEPMAALAEFQFRLNELVYSQIDIVGFFAKEAIPKANHSGVADHASIQQKERKELINSIVDLTVELSERLQNGESSKTLSSELSSYLHKLSLLFHLPYEENAKRALQIQAILLAIDAYQKKLTDPKYLREEERAGVFAFLENTYATLCKAGAA